MSRNLDTPNLDKCFVRPVNRDTSIDFLRKLIGVKFDTPLFEDLIPLAGFFQCVEMQRNQVPQFLANFLK